MWGLTVTEWLVSLVLGTRVPKGWRFVFALRWVDPVLSRSLLQAWMYRNGWQQVESPCLMAPIVSARKNKKTENVRGCGWKNKRDGKLLAKIQMLYL